MALMIETAPTSKYPPLEEGLYQGVLAEIVDLGEIQGKFDERPFKKLQLVFQLDSVRDDGKRHEVRSHPEKASINEKSNLRTKFIEKMLGKDNALRLITAAGAQFDIEAAILGVNCQIEVIHNSTGEYANIGSIIAYRGKTPLTTSDDYEPLQTREHYKAPSNFFEPLTDEQASAATGNRAEPVTPIRAPQASANSPEKIPDNDPRMSNKGPSHKDYLKKFMAGETTLPVRPKPAPVAELAADEFDAFADEGEPGYIGEGANRQAALIEMPTAYPAN